LIKIGPALLAVRGGKKLVWEGEKDCWEGKYGECQRGMIASVRRVGRRKPGARREKLPEGYSGGV